MISEERLKELIEQEATIWTPAFHCSYEHDTPAPVMLSNNGLDRIGDGKLFSRTAVPIDIEYLFETFDEAQWFIDFGNIKRTEILRLPSWEEMSKYQYNEFKFYDKYGLGFNIVVVNGRDKYIVIRDATDLDDRFYADDVTKENYIKACELAKRLFLGGEEK